MAAPGGGTVAARLTVNDRLPPIRGALHAPCRTLSSQTYRRTLTMQLGHYDNPCPHCGSQEVERIHRTLFERLRLKSPKYRCRKCQRKFFRKKPV